MNVLVVTNMYPDAGKPAHGIFVKEQVESLRAKGVQIDVLFVDGPRNKLNYLKGILRLRQQLRTNRYNLIHAHYVYSGLIGLTQRRLPVVTTFHGSDVMQRGSIQPLLSRWVAARAHANIVVSSQMAERLEGVRSPVTVIPCGVDMGLFRPVDRERARARLELPAQGKLVLFFAPSRAVKQFDLAQRAVDMVRQGDAETQLILVSNRPREEIPLYLSACDVLVLTSQSEGSPQVIKEAMACNLPIVSTPVGDVAEVIAGTEGCYLCDPDPDDIAEKIVAALQFGRRTDGRQGVEHLSLERIADRVMALYQDVAARWSASRQRGVHS